MENEKKEFLEKMFLANYSDMETYAAKLLSNRDLARDAVQDTFLVAQVKIDKLMASEAPRGWLFNTLKNIIRNILRHQRYLSKVSATVDYTVKTEMELPVKTIYEHTVSNEDLKILIWVYCEGWPYAEVAKRLGISLDACKKRIQRAKERLRNALDE